MLPDTVSYYYWSPDIPELGTLSTYQAPVLTYYRWFYNGSFFEEFETDDILEVRLSNGKEEIILETLIMPDTTWKKAEFFIKDLDIELTNEMRVIFETGDTGMFSIIEVGIDHFEVVDDKLDVADEYTLNAVEFSIRQIRLQMRQKQV